MLDIFYNCLVIEELEYSQSMVPEKVAFIGQVIRNIIRMNIGHTVRILGTYQSLDNKLPKESWL